MSDVRFPPSKKTASNAPHEHVPYVEADDGIGKHLMNSLCDMAAAVADNHVWLRDPEQFEAVLDTL